MPMLKLLLYHSVSASVLYISAMMIKPMQYDCVQDNQRSHQGIIPQKKSRSRRSKPSNCSRSASVLLKNLCSATSNLNPSPTRPKKLSIRSLRLRKWKSWTLRANDWASTLYPHFADINLYFEQNTRIQAIFADCGYTTIQQGGHHGRKT